MQSRMNKYYESNDYLEETIELPSRLTKNQDLYKEVSNKALDDFDVDSNSSVLNENVNNTINIDKIKEMLDRKYRELPKNKSIGNSIEEIGKVSLDETREYDINAILEESHKDKEIDYEEERLKKLRTTQVNILKDLDSVLDVEEEKEEKDYRNFRKKEEEKLKELIDTITAKELISEEQRKELDPLDLLSDLKGDDDDTRVIGIVEDTKDNIIDLDSTDEDIDIDTKEEIDLDTTEENIIDTEEHTIKKEVKKEVKEKDEDKEKSEDKEEDTKSNTLTDSQTLSFTQSDFDDFNDLKEDMRFTKVLIRVLVVIIIIVFIVGCVLLANKVLNLGLF